MGQLTIDLVTEDIQNDEYVAYLVENGPWQPLEDRLKTLQHRLYDCFDAIVDGQLAERFPKSKGKHFRIQVDLHDSPPEQANELVRSFSIHLESNLEYKQVLKKSPFVLSLRVVTGADMGRHFE